MSGASAQTHALNQPIGILWSWEEEKTGRQAGKTKKRDKDGERINKRGSPEAICNNQQWREGGRREEREAERHHRSKTCTRTGKGREAKEREGTRLHTHPAGGRHIHPAFVTLTGLAVDRLVD